MERHTCFSCKWNMTGKCPKKCFKRGRWAENLGCEPQAEGG